MNNDQDDLVKVGFFSQAEEAALARNQLESIGIKAVLGEENSAGLGWALTGAQGGVSLLVSRSDAAVAQNFLDDKPWLYADDEDREGIATSRDISRMDAPARDEVGVATPRDILHMQPADRDDDEEHLTPREKNATRACKSAVFGLLILPLLPYAMYLLLSVCTSHERLAGRPRRHAWFAALVLAPVILVPIAMFLTLLLAPPPLRPDPSDLRNFPHSEKLVGSWRGTRDKTTVEMTLAANGDLRYRKTGPVELEATGSWAFTNFLFWVRLERVSKGVDPFGGQPTSCELEMVGRDEMILKKGDDTFRMVRH